MLSFKVMDEDTISADDFIGAASIPVPLLNQGYRHIRLRGMGNTELPHAALFVKITVASGSLLELLGCTALTHTPGPPTFSVG